MYPIVLEYGEQSKKTWKMRNGHVRTWNVARKLKSWKLRHKHCMKWDTARKNEKRSK
jgi:hypothetical protein